MCKSGICRILRPIEQYFYDCHRIIVVQAFAILKDLKSSMSLQGYSKQCDQNLKSGKILIDTSIKSLEFLCSLIPGQFLSIVLGEKDNMGNLKMMSQDRIKDLIKKSVQRKNQYFSRRMQFYNLAIISPFLNLKYGIQN